MSGYGGMGMVGWECGGWVGWGMVDEWLLWVWYGGLLNMIGMVNVDSGRVSSYGGWVLWMSGFGGLGMVEEWIWLFVGWL